MRSSKKLFLSITSCAGGRRRIASRGLREQEPAVHAEHLSGDVTSVQRAQEGHGVRHVLGLTEGITRVRGKWNLYQSVALNRAIPVMPTLHPAYLLRQPGAKRLAWRDLLAVAEKMGELGLA